MAMFLYADSEFTSPYTMSVFVALTEKQLPFEIRTLDLARAENNAPGYAKTSLTQRVPTLIDGDFAISEFSAIAEYLEEVYPDPPIFPVDRQMRARARQVQAWLRSDLMPIRLERPTSTIFYHPVSTPLSPEAQTASDKLLAAALELLSHGGENLFGEWSIADVDLAVMLHRLILNGRRGSPSPGSLCEGAMGTSLGSALGSARASCALKFPSAKLTRARPVTLTG
jgi:glutathione S-transferase